MKMKRFVAMLSAAVLVSGCTLFHLQDNEIRRELWVHAASVEDLTFSIEGKSSFAVTTARNEGMWETSEEKYAVLKKCNPYASGKIEIPSEYNGVKVLRIATYAFSKCYDLTEIIIPDNVESIGAGAFSECEGLVSVNLPNGLKAINGSTFSGCKSLKYISIPESVETMYSGAFYNCEKLTEISIPNSVKQFVNASSYSGVFSGCNGVKTIMLSANLKEIPEGTFSDCSSLESIVIPNGVQLVADEAFKECKSLKEVTFSESVTNIRKNVFRYCNSLQSVIIQNPNCVLHEFYEYGNLYSFSPTIYGIAGSTAETYAKEHNLTFKPLEDAPPPEQNENTLPLAPEGSIFGDVDGDEDITVADAQAVLQFYVKKMSGNTPSWSEVTGNANAPS